MENAKKTYLLSIGFVPLYRGADSEGRCKIIFWERMSKLCTIHFCQQTTLFNIILIRKFMSLYMAYAAVYNVFRTAKILCYVACLVTHKACVGK